MSDLHKLCIYHWKELSKPLYIRLVTLLLGPVFAGKNWLWVLQNHMGGSLHGRNSISIYNRDSLSCNIGTACGFTEFHPMNQIYSLWRQDPAVRVYIAVLCFKHSAKYPQLIAICVHIFNVYEKIFTAILNTEWITTLDYLTLCKSSLVT